MSDTKQVDSGSQASGEGPSLSPLFVDLDGTLVSTDLLLESALIVAEGSRRSFLSAVWALKHGRSALKYALAVEGRPAVENLPYRQEVIEFIRHEKARGRPIVLATASTEELARAVADHLGGFDFVLGSSERVNLKGEVKRAAIEEECRRRGWSAFAYIGDSSADLPIFEAASEAFVVSRSRQMISRVELLTPVACVFAPPPGRFKAGLRLLRPHQWAKNGLVVAPVLLSHQWGDPTAWVKAFFAAAAFCLFSSTAYIVNDLFDIESDRRHQRKRTRPLAAGTFPISAAILLVPLLIAGGAAIAFGLVGWKFGLALLAYLALTLSYTFVLKKKLMVDVVTLAILYTLRILAGCLAIGVPASSWLLTFSIFCFTSLALAKRFTELRLAEKSGALTNQRRGYYVTDLLMMPAAGLASAFAACLTLALYIESVALSGAFVRPQVLWLLVPMLVYWMTRVWFLAGRDQLHDDPVVFAMRDRVSRLTLVACVAIFLSAAVTL